MQFEIQESHAIPFYGGDKKLGEAVKSAGARRNMNPVHFAFRKIKNIILALNGREWFEEDDFYYSQECAFEYAFVRTSLISSLSIYASLKDHQFVYR